jgi:hypothetical protein
VIEVDHAPHDHSHGPAGEHPPAGGPVVLDIGAGYGAAIVRCPDDLAGHELHVEPVEPGGGAGLHTGIWSRQMGGEHVVVAVFPALRAGRYRLHDSHGQHYATPLVIADGHVSELDLT